MTKDNKKKKRDYDVGYAKPPKESQFKKGESGNRKGRPKGAKGVLASLKRELESKITVREGNREVRISKAEAMAKRFAASGLKGDTKVLIALLKLDPELFGSTAFEVETDVPARPPEPVDYDILRHFLSLPTSNDGDDAPSENGDIDKTTSEEEEQDSDDS